MPNRFLNNITVNDSYTLPNADGSVNQVITTDGAGNLSFIDVNSVVDTATGEVYYTVKNSTGSQLLKGKAVMAVGTDGNSGHILVDEMVADGSVDAKYFLGILAENINNGNTGKAIHFGQIDQFDTRGQNGETWNDGDILWCDPANPGDFTITEPDGPNLKKAPAFILKSTTNGKIQVRVEINEGVKDLYDTKITSQVDGDVLVWDDTTGVWFNDSTLNVDYTAGHVGIGTTSPNDKLEIKSTTIPRIRLNSTNTSFPTFGSITAYNNTTYRGELSWANNPVQAGARITYIGFPSGSQKTGTFEVGADFVDTTISNGAMVTRLTTTGLGIGTTSPGSILHIVDAAPTLKLQSNLVTGSNTISFDNSLGIQEGSLIYNTASNSLRLNNNTGNSRLKLDNYTGAFSVGTNNLNQSGVVLDAGTLSLISNFSTALTCDFAGRVGIGTTTPQTKLHVANGTLRTWTPTTGTSAIFESTASNRNFLTITATNESEIWFGDATTQAKGRVRYENNNDTMEFWTNANPRININSSGNVGIGTTSPTDKLTVQDGNIRLNSTSSYPAQGLYAYWNNSSPNMGGISWHNNPGFIGSEWSHYRQTSPYTLARIRLIGDASTGGMFVNLNSSDVFTIKASTGNVGIGTTSPGDPLTVVGKISSLGGTNNAKNVKIYANDSFGYLTTNASKIYMSTQLQVDSGLIGSYNEDLQLQVSGSTKMYINSSGNVGIGTTSPNENLHVFDTTPTVKIQSNGFYPGAYIDFTSNTDAIVSRIHSYSNPGGSGLDIGYESFGTTSSSSKVQLKNGFMYFSTAGSVRAAILSNGNFGIGLTNPSQKLHVNGSAIISGNVGIGTTSPNAKLDVVGKVKASGLDIDGTGNADTTFITYTRTDLTQPASMIYDGTGGFKFNANGLIYSFTDNNGLGIGTTSPSEKLEVDGHIKAVDGYKGYLPAFQHGGFYHSSSSSSSAIYWIPTNYISETTSSQYYNNWIAPYDGRVSKIVMRYASGTTPTATSVTFRYAVNSTTSTSTFPATVTNGASTNMTATKAFGDTDITFNAGDKVLVGFSTDGGTRLLYGFSYTIVFEYNIT